jgi:hypothetical protein
VVKGITIVKISGEAVFRVVDLIINIIYYHRSLNKRSIIYIENLDTS